MDDLSLMLLGAAFVAIGVLVTALADRIRGVRITGERAQRPVATRAKPLASLPRDTPAANDARADEVIGALVAAGYSKRVAAAATAGCAFEQRATPETWTRAALRRCAEAAS